ncbi:prepilin peptidase [Blastococcus haudaquaticus]|uniref:Leader peptidase (Prepilin peptidase) / N-methyltransferase n=1 Tax=Blastococcus haudaquaticus TaxID=1938745 RepID=A0A286H7A9_9ACTN|nr:A24 family peptidase [Blastococcus haudaquaticus]SOE03229.1 leader peptidase (prepilin peptidase) / N-methyltransferase [Blastococcus haudaquaticus]
MEVSRLLLLGVALLAALLAGPWLARVAVRLAARDDAAVPSAVRTGVMTAVLAVLLAGSVLLTGDRPATVALAWAAGAAVVLGAVDLLSHRLPDAVTYPAVAVCAAAFVVDAAVLGTWTPVLRALAAAGAAFGVGVVAALLSPDGFGFGDVKLLGLLGLVLGWFGWGVLLTGVFLGLLTGALVSLVLLATRRAGWRTAIPFGPPLLAGAVLVLALGSVSLT